ncbi:DUF2828 family protein, partial [Arthrospira platensis SPKY2]
MDVAVSLGIYISERLTGPMKDHFMTFTTKPSMVKLNGKTLLERVTNMKRADWGMGTNIEAAFQTLLDHAVRLKVAADQMPTMIL